MADPALTIFGVQWREGTEPWGWETTVHLTDEGEAERVFGEALNEVREVYRNDPAHLSWALRQVRMVRIHVFEKAPPSDRNPEGEPIGVEEIERGG